MAAAMRTIGLRIALLLLVVPLIGGLTAASHHATATAQVTPPRAVRPTLPHPAPCTRPAPTTAAGFQSMFDAKNDRTWAGADQAASVALPDGRVLWLFGDTFRGGRTATGARTKGSDVVRNSALLQSGGCLTAVRGPAGAEVLPTRADGQWYWPQDAVVQGDHVIVFATRMRRTGNGPFDFASTGVDAAVFALRNGSLELERMTATPSSAGGDEYGKAFVREGSWLLVYGSRQVPHAFGRAVVVARVRPDDLLQPGSWQFWDGSGWSTQAELARPTVAASPAGWSTAFSVFRTRQGSLRMLTKENDVWGSAVITGTATSPTAAFSRKAVLSATSSRTTGALRYNALAHPEQRLANGRLLVTVCRNSSSLTRVWADTNLYKPQFYAVTA